MDIYNHAASGAVVGMALGAARFGGAAVSGRVAFASCAFGAVMPDVDGVTFGLGAWGRQVYRSDHWYSHHQASHSILGCAILALVFALAWSLLQRRRGAASTSWRVIAALLFCGGLVHLAGDAVTPGGPWGGLPLLFPIRARFGGWSLVWWWHHFYPMFVFLAALSSGVVLALAARWFPAHSRHRARLQFVVAVIALLLVTRYFAMSRFEETGDYHADDLRAMEAQREWLPEPVYRAFVAASGVLPLNF